MSRRIRWNDDEFVHVRPDGDEACFEDCVELRDQWGEEVVRTFTLPFRTWVWLAESILSTRDRREAEAAKQPKRWFVDLTHQTAELDSDQSKGRVRNYIPLRTDRGEATQLYVWAKDEKDAMRQAREANHSLAVWIREYLA